jgi:hypothetical protein
MDISDIQQGFYESLDRSMWAYISLKHRRALKTYPVLFDATIEHRFALINFLLYRNKGTDGETLEGKLAFSKSDLFSKAKQLLRTVYIVENNIKNKRVDYETIRKFADRNVHYAAQHWLRSAGGPGDFSKFVDITNAAKTIRDVLSDREVRLQLISQTKNPFLIEGKCALEQVATGYELHNYIPILKIAVEAGYVDQEEAHLAIIKGRKIASSQF